MHSRRFARKLAVQILFANEFLKEDIQTIAQRIAQSLNVEVPPFTMEIIRITVENEDELNQLIKQHLRNWDFDRVAILDRVLIRMALGEMLFFPDIPVEVTINEAIEICKEFSDYKTRRFVNGILDSIYRDLKSSNRLQKTLAASSSGPVKKAAHKKGRTQ